MLNRLSPSASLDMTEGEQGFDLREILSFAWRQWKFIASIVCVTLVLAALYLLKETPRYTANALVLLEGRQEKAAGAEAILSDINLRDLGVVESQMAIIRSTVFLGRVVEKERLISDPEFGTGKPRDPSTLSTIRSYFFGPPRETARPTPDGQIVPRDVMGSIQALKGATEVARAGQGYVLSISVTSVDPARAARLANAVADAYIVDKLDARFEAAKRASAWLSDRLSELRKQLRESEEAVAQFRTEHGLIQSGSNVTLSQQQLSDLNAKLMAARAEAAEKKARIDLLRSIETQGGNAQSVPGVSASSALASLRQQEATISQREADLVARYNDRHPLVVNVRAENRDVQRAISAETRRLAEGIKNEYELAKAREEAVERSFQEVTGQTGIDNKTGITLRELERTAAVNKSLFEDFLQRAKITQEQSTFEAREARVITPALPPGGPSHPRNGRTMAIALVIGLFIGVGGALAKEKLNSGFTTPRQIEEILEVPLLTSVSRFEQRDLTVNGKVVQIPLYPAAMPLSRFSESMRALRSGIQMTDVDNPPKVVQLTSTLPSEGKTTIALSLAVSTSCAGLKVLFIDADLRHPSASRFFGLQNELGLVDLLLGAVNPQDIIKFHRESKMWMLPAGSKTQNPADLLGSDRMKSFITRCKESFDLVVIDTPPIGPVIDPIVVAQLTDKIVYVVRWAVTARELVQQSIQRLPGHKKLAGVAFNHVDEGEAQKYGKHAYPYYYGSRYYKKYYNG